MDRNIKYYEDNADSFIDHTFKCDMSVQYDFFEKELVNKSTILDLGFGSGRDSLYFLSKGYKVYALDPVEKFCKIAKELGIKNVYQREAQDIDFVNIFDGIWACASLLHIPSSELKDVFKRCYAALKKDGLMYVSFRYGDFEGVRTDRCFVDLTEESLKELINDTGFVLDKSMISIDVRPDNQTKWLNAVLKKR